MYAIRSYYVSKDGPEGISNFVGHARGKSSDRCQLLRADQLLLGLF